MVLHHPCLLVLCSALMLGFFTVVQPSARAQFVDVTAEAKIGFQHENGASKEKLMPETFGSGVAWLDYDNDGWLDLYFVNGANLNAGEASPGNALLRNTGKGAFVDVTRQAGAAGDGGFGTGAAVGDYDGDGYPDIYVAGYSANILYRDVSAESGPAFRIKHVGRGAATGDFDNDGDLDIVVSNCGQKPILMRNDGGNRNRWVAIKARGRQSNYFGVGAKVSVETAGGKQVKEIGAAGSYLSSSDLRLYFGLGGAQKVKRLEIVWPSGRKQTLTDVAADQTLLLEEANARL